MYHFDWIRRYAERTPHKLALVEAHSGRRLTYAELDHRITLFAAFLWAELGIRRGDRISILAKNSAAYYEILFACSRVGCILNTLNWRLAGPELAYILQDCEPRMLLYESEFADNVRNLRAGLNIEGFLQIDGPTSVDDWSYEDALAAAGPSGSLPLLSYDDTWAIIYTSGTTGRPKGAQVTYGNFFYNAVGMGRAIDLNSQDVNLNVLPTFHIGGLGLFAAPTFHAGGTVIDMRSFDPAQFLALVQEWRVSVILLVPAMYLMLSQYPDFDQVDLSSVRVWASGGSALPPALLQEYAARDVLIQQGFGMTETGPSVFLINKEDVLRKPGSVGKPVLHTDVCIMDRERRTLGPGEVGELCIRGGNVTSGYWNRPQATAEAIVEGWLHSGDAAKYDEEGFYYIVDRWKDMFISGGENVYPAEVENVLYQIPAVAEAAVFGVPHPKWQEVGKAVIVCKEDHALSEQEVIAFCKEHLAGYKVPKSVIFIDALPRTAAGKVLKRELRETYA